MARNDSKRTKIPACVWALADIVPQEPSLKYAVNNLRLHAVGGQQRAIATDGIILIVVSWEEASAVDCYVPKTILDVVRRCVKPECEACGSSPPVLRDGFIGFDGSWRLKIDTCGWELSFPDMSLKYPQYEKIFDPKEAVCDQADYWPLMLSRVGAALELMGCRRASWQLRKDSLATLAGKVEECEIKGFLMPMFGEAP